MWAASIAAARGRARPNGQLPKIHLDLYSRSRREELGTRRQRCSSRRSANPLGVAEVLGPDRHERRPGGEEFGRVGAARDSPHADDRQLDRGRTARSWCSAIGRTAGPERPPWPAAERGLAGSGIDRARLQGVDQRDGVGAALFGGDRDRRRVGDVGRQLDDQRLLGQRAQRFQQRRGLGRVLADDQAGVDIGTGDVQLDRGDSSRSPTASTSRANSSWLGRHHRDDQRHRQLRQLRQVLGEEPLQALVRQPDRVDHPRRRLPDPRRLVAGPRLRRDRLRDEGGEGEILQQRVTEDRCAAIASKVPEALITGCSSSMPQSSSSIAVDAQPRRPRSLDLAAQHRAVDAEPHIAALGASAPRSRSRRRSRRPSATPSPARRRPRARRTSPAPPPASPEGRRSRRRRSMRRRPPATRRADR